MQALRAIYRFWTALVFVAIVVQIGAAGYGAFYAADKSDPGPLSEHQFSHGFNFHDGFGYAVFLGTVLLFLFALSRGPGAYRSFLRWLDTPWSIALSAIILGAVLYHTVQIIPPTALGLAVLTRRWIRRRSTA